LAGSSEYSIDGKAVPAQKYNASLEKHNILVKAKNFLVFQVLKSGFPYALCLSLPTRVFSQGDVEQVASQSSKDLSKLIDQISGSLELKSEYDRLKLAAEKAQEVLTGQYGKRKGINSEIKTFKEQKSEAEKFSRLKDEKVLSLGVPFGGLLIVAALNRTRPRFTTSSGSFTTFLKEYHPTHTRLSGEASLWTS
jgi:structural maintenance of chromosome 1